MRKRTMVLAGLVLGSCLALSVAVDEKPPKFFFGGQQVYVGMSVQEAVAALSHCCKLSPPVESDVEKWQVPKGTMPGHMILSKEESQMPILGAVYFSGGRVLRVTRPLDQEIDTANDDVVGFARAINRFLAANGESEMSALVSIRHERMSNAESDVLLLSLRDGRGIEIHIGTLDKPNTYNDKRDFVSLDATLEPPLQK